MTITVVVVVTMTMVVVVMNNKDNKNMPKTFVFTIQGVQLDEARATGHVPMIGLRKTALTSTHVISQFVGHQQWIALGAYSLIMHRRSYDFLQGRILYVYTSYVYTSLVPGINHWMQ